jgi:hypothetical protein
MNNQRGHLTGELLVSIILMIVFGKLAAALVFTPGGITGWKIAQVAAALPCLYFLVRMAQAGAWHRNFVLTLAVVILSPIFFLVGGRRMVEARCRAELGSLRAAVSSYHEQEKRFPQDLSELVREGKYLKQLPKALTFSYHAATEAKVTNGVSADDAGGWIYNNVAGDPNFGSVSINCTHTDSNEKSWNSY